MAVGTAASGCNQLPKRPWRRPWRGPRTASHRPRPVRLAARLEALVVRRPPGRLFHLSGRFLAGVLDLVAHGHDVPSFVFGAYICKALKY